MGLAATISLHVARTCVLTTASKLLSLLCLGFLILKMEPVLSKLCLLECSLSMPLPAFPEKY